MNSSERDIHYLLDLMDDDNEQSASLAMAELLRSDRPDIVNRRLCELQETSNPCLRRRVHQLQSAIGARFNRGYLAEQLRAEQLPLLDGAIRLHLMWFDNDTYDNVALQWNELRDDFLDIRPRGLKELADFMMEQNFTLPSSRDDSDPELYCIGCVLDGMPGSDLILSLLCSQLTVQSPLPLRIIRDGLDFGVMDVRGNKLFPSDNWRVVRARRGNNSQFMTDAVLLRMIAAALFVSAASSDGFRYLFTLGSTLAASIGKDFPDFLPYPYNITKK